MALIKCPECNKEISSKAFDCPACGYAVNKKPKSSLDKLLDVVRFIIVGFLLLMFLGGVGSLIAGLVADRKEGDTKKYSSVSKNDEIVLKKQWRQLKQGMTQKQVKDILGEPIKVETSSVYMKWDYDYFAWVEFPTVDFMDNKGLLESWNEPNWQ